MGIVSLVTGWGVVGAKLALYISCRCDRILLELARAPLRWSCYKLMEIGTANTYKRRCNLDLACADRRSWNIVLDADIFLAVITCCAHL